MILITDDGKKHDIAFAQINGGFSEDDTIIVYVRDAGPVELSDVYNHVQDMFPENKVVTMKWETRIEKRATDFRDLFKRYLRMIEDAAGDTFDRCMYDYDGITAREANEVRDIIDEMHDEDEVT